MLSTPSLALLPSLMGHPELEPVDWMLCMPCQSVWWRGYVTARNAPADHGTNVKIDIVENLSAFLHVHLVQYMVQLNAATFCSL